MDRSFVLVFLLLMLLAIGQTAKKKSSNTKAAKPAKENASAVKEFSRPRRYLDMGPPASMYYKSGSAPPLYSTQYGINQYYSYYRPPAPHYAPSVPMYHPPPPQPPMYNAPSFVPRTNPGYNVPPMISNRAYNYPDMYGPNSNYYNVPMNPMPAYVPPYNHYSANYQPSYSFYPPPNYDQMNSFPSRHYNAPPPAYNGPSYNPPPAYNHNPYNPPAENPAYGPGHYNQPDPPRDFQQNMQINDFPPKKETEAEEKKKERKDRKLDSEEEDDK